MPLHVLNGANKSAVPVISGTNLFLESHREKTWAITGTKGKSTTSSLLYAALKDGGINAAFAGNIGIPALSMINHPCDLFVLELSSYQLEDCAHSPHGALFLNLFSEHLDHHQTFDAYGDAKARIAKFQNENDILILPSHDERLTALTAESRAQRVSFGTSDSASWIESGRYRMRRKSGAVDTVCAITDTKLKGPGNCQNILAVLAALSNFDISAQRIAATIAAFSPLPHRLEELPSIGGISYVNDSISTVPEATINALETFGAKVKTLILGGFDRGLSFDGLAEYLVASAVETILFFPPSGARIQAAIERCCEKSQRRIQYFDVKSMDQAAALAREVTPEGHICLLSPASPSFPIFKNFEERGELFKRAVAG